MGVATKADAEFQDYTIERVAGSRERGWSVTFDGCTCCGIPADSPIEPVVGMAIRLWPGGGIGCQVRGIALDGHEVFYRTPEEQRAENERRAAEAEAKRRADFEAKREEYDRRYSALPDEFRRRLDRFRAGCDTFRWEFEPYELFACEQAVVIAEAFRLRTNPRAAIMLWSSSGGELQRQQVPDLSDQHSGNTFGMACRLAMWFLTEPEVVVFEHCSMSPLVGCGACGCTHDAAREYMAAKGTTRSRPPRRQRRVRRGED